MPNPTEVQTRREKIDPLLKEQGWDVKNRSQVVLEVDTKQSNFVTRVNSVARGSTPTASSNCSAE